MLRMFQLQIKALDVLMRKAISRKLKNTIIKYVIQISCVFLLGYLTDFLIND